MHVLVPLLLAAFFVLRSPSVVGATSTVCDAVDDKIQVTGTSALNLTQVTITLWLYRVGNGETATNKLIERDGDVLWEITDNGTSLFFRTLWSTVLGVWSVPVPAANTWTHYAWAYDGSSTANDPDVYKDGVLQSETETSTPSGTYLTSTTAALVVCNNITQSVTWNGRVANLAIYNRKISSAGEIRSIMHCGPQAVRNGLVLSWPMGVFAGNNYTTTASMSGTESGTPARSATGPPVSCPQGGMLE